VLLGSARISLGYAIHLVVASFQRDAA